MSIWTPGIQLEDHLPILNANGGSLVTEYAHTKDVKRTKLTKPDLDYTMV